MRRICRDNNPAQPPSVSGIYIHMTQESNFCESVSSFVEKIVINKLIDMDLDMLPLPVFCEKMAAQVGNFASKVCLFWGVLWWCVWCLVSPDPARHNPGIDPARHAQAG